MNNFYILSAGVSQLVGFLKTTQNVSQVYSANDVVSLKDIAISPELRSLNPNQVIFILSDNLPSNDQNLNVFEFVRRVSGAGYHVIVVALSNQAINIGKTFPQVKIVANPVKINDLLYTISSFGFSVLPADNPNLTIDVNTIKENSFGSGWTPPNTTKSLNDIFDSSKPPANNNWQRPEPTVQQPSNTLSNFLVNNPNIENNQNNQINQNNQSNITSFPNFNNQNNFGMQNNQVNVNTQQSSLNDFQFRPQNNSNPQDNNISYNNPITSNSPNRTLADFVTSRNFQSQPPSPVDRFNNQNSKVSYSKRRGMVITVSVSKGGTGKSTLSLNLAAYLGSRFKNSNPNRTVCIIDTNYQQADTGKYLGQYTPNIVNLIKDPSLMTPDRILNSLVHRSDMNFSALLGPATPDDALSLLTADTGQTGSSFSGRFYSEVLSLLKLHYDYIFIDTPVAEKFHSLFRDFALPNADYLIVPVIPSKQTVHNTYMWLNSAVTAPKVARGAGMNPEQIGIVLNRAEEGVGYGELEIMEELRNFNFLGSVPETKEWKKANNEGELIASKNKTEINEAFAKILSQVTGENLIFKSNNKDYEDDSSSFFSNIFKKIKGK